MDLKIIEQQDYSIVKANEIIQKARNELPLKQLKALAFILSKVKPTDKPGQSYSFTVSDFCKVCEINLSGRNYTNLKNALQALRDRSFWIIDEEGCEVLMAWIEKPKIDYRTKTIEITLDKDMQKYVIGWLTQYTQYCLWEVVPMKSRFSFVLFELLKSYSWQEERSFQIDDLKSKIGAKYSNFKDFRIKVLDIATREINTYTNLEISWEPIYKGRKVTDVVFRMRKKNEGEVFKRKSKEPSNQITIYDCIDDNELSRHENMIKIT